MESLRTAIVDLVQAIVRDQNGVTVTEVEQNPWIFEVKVSPVDFDLVFSKIGAIKTLASSFAGLDEREQVFINVAEGKDNSPSGRREEDRTD